MEASAQSGQGMDVSFAAIPSALLADGPSTSGRDGGGGVWPFRRSQQQSPKGGPSGARDPRAGLREAAVLLSKTVHALQAPPGSWRELMAPPSMVKHTTGSKAQQRPQHSLVKLGFGLAAPRLFAKNSDVLRGLHALPLSGSEPDYDDRDRRWWTEPEVSSYSYALRDFQSGREEAAVPGDVCREQADGYVEEQPVLSCRDFVKQVLSDNPKNVICVKPDDRCPTGWHKVMSFVNLDNLDEDDSSDLSDEAVNYLDHHFYVQHKDAYITLQQGDRIADAAEFLQMPVSHLYAHNPHVSRDQQGPAVPLEQRTTLHVPDANVWSHKPSEDAVPRIYDGHSNVIRDPRRAAPAFSEEGEDGVRAKCELPSTFCCTFCVHKGRAKTGSQLGRKKDALD